MKTKRMVSILLVFVLCAVWIGTGNVLPGEASEVKLENPRRENGDTLWDCVYFGSYYMDGQVDVKEPIKWRILSVKGQDAFIISDTILDAGAFHDVREAVTWKDSYMRAWLNGAFYHCAFSAEEKKAIFKTKVVTKENPDYGTPGGAAAQDFVYLPSLEEVKQDSHGFSESGYYGDGRGAKNTAYAASGGTQGGAMRPAGKYDWWWLRSAGVDAYHAAQVLDTGYVANYGSEVDYRKCGIRPVLHLDLSKISVWSYAGKTNLEGEQINPSVPSPKPPQPPQKVTAPKKVKIRSVKKSGKRILVKWNKTSCSGYQVLVSTDKKFKKNKKSYFISSSKTVKKAVKPWKGNRTYYVKVRAFRKSGKGKVYGAYSQRKSIKYKVSKGKK